MKQIDLDYWYKFGRAMACLEECFALVPCMLDARDVSRISTALGWLRPIATGQYLVIPGTPGLAQELIELISPYSGENNQPLVVNAATQATIQYALTAFHNVIRSGSQEIYTFLVSGIGAYSAAALVGDATSHLSELAQKTLEKSEKEDFILAGACLACAFPTASGFHAMRSLEAEARRYHMAVTGIPKEVDWTLDPLINGNSGRNQFGLRDQWKKEGSRNDSPLLLIITLLSSIAPIYRNPIMHPEMTLDKAKAKLIFDTTALSISAMAEDREKRKTAIATPIP